MDALNELGLAWPSLELLLMGAAWVAASLVVARTAQEKGRSFVGFLVMSLALSPIFAVLALNGMPDLARERRAREGLHALLDPMHQQLDAIRSGASRVVIPTSQAQPAPRPATASTEARPLVPPQPSAANPVPPPARKI